MFFSQQLVPAQFVYRPNRFVVHITVQEKADTASLPNPGKLGELLHPGAVLWVYSTKDTSNRHPWRVAAVETADNRVIMLDTQVTNRVAEVFLQRKMIPALAEYTIEKREYTCGKSRFDFLLKRGQEKLILEVKSCTLFHKTTAMFPDAVTSRGARHVSELARLSRQGYRAAVLFMVHGGHLNRFSPEFHTDPVFARTLYDARKDISIYAQSLSWSGDLQHVSSAEALTTDWRAYETHGADSGIYLVLLKNEEDQTVCIGSRGDIFFKRGYYFYVGSAKKNLAARIQRHTRRRKNMHWHVDYLRDKTSVIQVFPIRLQGEYECRLAQDIRAVSQSAVAGFGSSDCSCESHLFYFSYNPQNAPAFQRILLKYRMEYVWR
jgi:sugar fermentation stimulation protein A